MPEAGAAMDHIVGGSFPSGAWLLDPPAVQFPRLHLQVEQRARNGEAKKVAHTHRHGVYSNSTVCIVYYSSYAHISSEQKRGR